MTATQAPTPGPLSVGDRVVAIADLRKHPDGPVWVQKGEEVGIVREYGIDNCIAGVALQDGREGDWAKSCFRLAPTAPIEASGSERGQAGAVMDALWPLLGGNHTSAELWTEIDAAVSEALRPQPSGETREAVARVIDPQAFRKWESRKATVEDKPRVDRALSKADNILDLLSARPLALGGQQGEERERIAKIIDPEAFVPMEDVIGMRNAFAKADAILGGRHD